jgi:hypothetical protein
MLRAVPGVLDCSVDADGVALVVHPEVDSRMIALRAKAVLADIGDATRPLLVLGGMTTGPPPSPPMPRRRRRPARAAARRPLSATGAVVLAVALLAVLPVTRHERQTSAPPSPPVSAPSAAPAPADSEPEASQEAATVKVDLAAPALVAAVGPTSPSPSPSSASPEAEAEAEADAVHAVHTAALVVPPSPVVRVRGSARYVRFAQAKAAGGRHRKQQAVPTTKATSGKPERRKATGLQES